VKKTVMVRILDRDYLIRSDDGEDQVRKVADLVNERFQQVKEHADGMTEKKIAILAAFDIAGDYLHLAKEHDALRAELQSRLRALNDQIDSTVGSGSFL
jgi:cell division protein ZapA